MIMSEEITSEAIITKLDQRIEEINSALASISLPKPSAKSFYDLEVTLRTLTRELCDVMAAKRLQIAINSEDIISESTAMIKALPQKIKNYGLRLTPVRMSNGSKIDLLVPYYARPCQEKKMAEEAEELDYTQLSSSSVFSMLAPRY
jgi:ferredoxin-thioredoxin reductase catalytic subunit